MKIISIKSCICQKKTEICSRFNQSNMNETVKTLNQFIVEKQAEFAYAKGELTRLLSDISTAAKIVNREINKAGLVDILGSAGKVNIQGEEVKKLDEYANEQFISALASGGECCVIASEEDEDIIAINNSVAHDAKYAITIDPLDGSSNIDVNASIGTIFSIYRRVSETGPGTNIDCMQEGNKQVAAGYIIYGSSTMLVYTTGCGVNGFTLDPSIGEFCLSHPTISIPKTGNIFSINEGNSKFYSNGVNKFIAYCKGLELNEHKPMSARYIGSLVADFHRNLLKGGIFIYPSSTTAPEGKLRLVYEANPVAFIIEQAGGRATNGKQRIMDIKPESLHQRVPLYIGSEDMVKMAEQFISKND